MEKHLAYVEIKDNNGNGNTSRVMASMPTITMHSDYDFLQGTMLMHRYRYDEVEIDIIEESKHSHMPFIDWATDIRECDTGIAGFIAPYKKDLKIYFPEKGGTIELFGCLITSFTKEILDDEDIITHSVFKNYNYNFCKREVLFEKVGHEKIRSIISLILSIDQARLY